MGGAPSDARYGFDTVDGFLHRVRRIDRKRLPECGGVGIQRGRFRMRVEHAQCRQPARSIGLHIRPHGPFGDLQEPRHFGARDPHSGQVDGFDLPLYPRMRIVEAFLLERFHFFVGTLETNHWTDLLPREKMHNRYFPFEGTKTVAR